MSKNVQLSNYDFSCKKVRFNGKCLTKIDLGYHLHLLRPSMAWYAFYDVFSYDELVCFLKKYLNEVYKD